jgi:hypothetical protein
MNARMRRIQLLSLILITCISYLDFSAVLRQAPRKAAKHAMYLKCAHPECSSDFDYGQGRLFRFRQTAPHEKQPSHHHGVKHYWLCSRCCESFTIEYQKGLGVLLMEKLETAGVQPCYYVLQPEDSPKPVLPRRLIRSRARHQRKQNRDLAPVAASSIEVLETRNLERRGTPQ